MAKGDELGSEDVVDSEGQENETGSIYDRVIERAFLGSLDSSSPDEVIVEREAIGAAVRDLGVEVKNLGDVIYSYRYRRELPERVRVEAGPNRVWMIEGAGRARYRFVAVRKGSVLINPSEILSETKIPDGTPGIIARYALDDEQALLAMVRYNRLIDIFTGVACYSLQNHLRTAVPGRGQVETDELYVGLDEDGVHYAFPVQAKAGNDRLSIVQIEQDFDLCAQKFPGLLARPIAAQFISRDLIALFEFVKQDGSARLHREKHYKLVSADDLTDEEVRKYRERLGSEGR